MGRFKRFKILLTFLLLSIFLTPSESFFLDWRFLQSVFGVSSEKNLNSGLGFGIISNPRPPRNHIQDIQRKEDNGSEILEDETRNLNVLNGSGSLRKRSDNSVKELEGDELGSVKCFDDLGCVSITEGWFDLLQRPINLLPFDREKINTRFILYTPARTIDPIQVFANKSSLIDGGFDPSKPIKVIIHGFIDTGFSSWVIKMAQAFVTKIGDLNVLTVDWGGGSLPLYTQATANTRVVGLEIAHFINFLIDEFGVDPGNVHLIGHSLGAHVSGYAGEQIKGLGRITGLDPAEPYFQFMPTFVRLDPGDAKFVDVIHTDGRTILLLGYGMFQPCGHIDFYPNDGREQPGCDIAEVPMNLIQAHGFEEAQRELFACNHNRAIFYFIESIIAASDKKKCQLVGHVCPDYNSYLKGQCHTCGPDGSLCASMGIDADNYDVGNRTLIPFYVSTAKTAPFCVRHYRLNVQLAFPPHAAPWVIGKLRMHIYGALGSIKDINLTPTDNMRVNHGTNVTFLVQTSNEIGDLEKIILEWKYEYNYLDVMSTCWAYLCNSKLFVKKVQVRDIDVDVKERRDSINALCGEEGTKFTGVSSGSSLTLQRPC